MGKFNKKQNFGSSKTNLAGLNKASSSTKKIASQM